jgi:sterol 14-demethylase
MQRYQCQPCLFCAAVVVLQGQNFAYLQIKTLWSVMLRNFEFELLDPVPEPDYTSMVIGPKACRVRYRRKKLVA